MELTTRQKITDLWIQNPFPDIALQAIGIELLNKAVIDWPELTDNCVNLMGANRPGIDWGKHTDVDISMEYASINIDADIFSSDVALDAIVLMIRSIIHGRIDNTEPDVRAPGNIIGGSLRLHMSTSRIGFCIGTLTWLIKD